MWGLAESPVSIALLESFYNSGKLSVLVCHSPGVLRHVTYQGAQLVKGKQVTGFTNGEEVEMQFTHVVPFLVEDELMRLGATFEKLADWQPLSVIDGHLITGQNPASSTVAAQTLVNCSPLRKPPRFLLRSTPASLDIGLCYAGQDYAGVVLAGRIPRLRSTAQRSVIQLYWI